MVQSRLGGLISLRSLAIGKSFASPRQEPVGVYSGHLDEAQNRVRGDREAAFVVMQGSEGNPQAFGQEWSAVFAVERNPYLANAHRKIAFERLPVGVGSRMIHGQAAVYVLSEPDGLIRTCAGSTL
jgi:hypothetical protein